MKIIHLDCYLVFILLLSSCQTKLIEDEMMDTWICTNYVSNPNAQSSSTQMDRDTLEISFLDSSTIILQGDTSNFDVIKRNTIKLTLNPKEKSRQNYADFKFELINKNQMMMYDLVYNQTFLLDRIAGKN